MTSGTGGVDPNRCVVCHNQPEKLAKIKDLPLIHDEHVTKHHVACFHCHEAIRHGLELEVKSTEVALGRPGEKPKTEAATQQGISTGVKPPMHLGVMTFECNLCHQNKHTGQLEMYSGRGLKDLGLPEMPSPMFLANVDCIGCHYQKDSGVNGEEFSGLDYRASENACIKCHGPKFKGVWQDSKAEVDKAIAALEKKRAAVRTKLDADTLSGSDFHSLERDLDRADQLQRFLRASHGEHNIYLASMAMRQEDEILGQVGTRVKAQMPDMSNVPLISGSFCATLCHAKIGVKVPPVTVKFQGKVMPHKMHTEQLGCASCHDIGAHKHVPLRKDYKQVCATCHS